MPLGGLGGRRSVPFPRFLADPLKSVIAGRDREDLAFPSPEGGVLRNNNFRRRALDRAATAVGLAGLTPHELRHTAASLAVAEGANVKAVQRMLGHASAAMTLDVCADLLEDNLDAVADRLDQAVTDRGADCLRTDHAGPACDAVRPPAKKQARNVGRTLHHANHAIVLGNPLAGRLTSSKHRGHCGCGPSGATRTNTRSLSDVEHSVLRLPHGAHRCPRVEPEHQSSAGPGQGR
ncbi:tyrosine-type recombinase/integrase [Actinoplanes sp. DH11]|uniref:tyrosine-type recombinase/integrase n=1 Tax=Actinoplanes sp. DH11 TaxID=2857011 RepID=UPI001E501434|nr:tyrosine-type recombinase/integrase [Actinoplanes sp. DH11]